MDSFRSSLSSEEEAQLNTTRKSFQNPTSQYLKNDNIQGVQQFLNDPSIQIEDALPLIKREQVRTVTKDLKQNHINSFNYIGQNQEDSSTDGQYDQEMDGDGMFQGLSSKCKHRTIVNYKCVKCGYEVNKIGSQFDSGVVNKYLRILPLSDELPETESECAKLIYEAFKPNNIILMREYILNLINKSLRRKLKEQWRNPAELKITRELLGNQRQTKPTFNKFYASFLQKFREQKQRFKLSDYLFIDSHFESGNIDKVYKIEFAHGDLGERSTLQKYKMFMSMDTNTRGHQQWFYFRVRNIRKDQLYQFTICNFTKPQSLYRKGMKLMWKSKKKQKQLKQKNDNEAWEIIPSENIVGEVSYHKSSIERNKRPMFKKKIFLEEGDFSKQITKKIGEGSSFYQLQFNLKFNNDNDTVYIAYARPYTYTEIITHMLILEYNLSSMSDIKDYSIQDLSANFDMTVNKKFLYKRRNFCYSLGGLPVPCIHITAIQGIGKRMKARDAIVISSRVHPGETNASYVFEGVFDAITRPNEPEFQALREEYYFVLIPCLNPDGVVKGNYRSNFAGVDLNRQWVLPQKDLHPTVYQAKQLFETLKQDRTIQLFCDLHGHSRKRNSFIYGCNKAANGGFNSWTKTRLFPRIFAKTNKIFDINSCKFKVEKQKMGTGRVVVWKEYEVTNSFTLENSFHGYDHGNYFKEFQYEDLIHLGIDLVLAIRKYTLVLHQIDFELKVTRGWLKPKRLLEITGTTAKDQLRKEQSNINGQFEFRKFNDNESQSSQDRSGLYSSTASKSNYRHQRDGISFQNLRQSFQNREYFDHHIMAAIKLQSFFKMIIMKQRYLKFRSGNNIGSQSLQESPNTRQKIKQSAIRTKYNEQLTMDVIHSERSFPSPQKTDKRPVLNSANYNKNKSSMNLQLRKPDQNLLEESQATFKSFFNENELSEAMTMIENGLDPSDHELVSPGGSDSDPSEDNFDYEELIENIYLQKNKMKKLIKQKVCAEKDFVVNFDKFGNKPQEKTQEKKTEIQTRDQSQKSLEPTAIKYDGPQNTLKRCVNRQKSQNQRTIEGNDGTKQKDGMLQLTVGVNQIRQKRLRSLEANPDRTQGPQTEINVLQRKKSQDQTQKVSGLKIRISPNRQLVQPILASKLDQSAGRVGETSNPVLAQTNLQSGFTKLSLKNQINNNNANEKSAGRGMMQLNVPQVSQQIPSQDYGNPYANSQFANSFANKDQVAMMLSLQSTIQDEEQIEQTQNHQNHQKIQFSQIIQQKHHQKYQYQMHEQMLLQKQKVQNFPEKLDKHVPELSRTQNNFWSKNNNYQQESQNNKAQIDSINTSIFPSVNVPESKKPAFKIKLRSPSNNAEGSLAKMRQVNDGRKSPDALKSIEPKPTNLITNRPNQMSHSAVKLKQHKPQPQIQIKPMNSFLGQQRQLQPPNPAMGHQTGDPQFLLQPQQNLPPKPTPQKPPNPQRMRLRSPNQSQNTSAKASITNLNPAMQSSMHKQIQLPSSSSNSKILKNAGSPTQNKKKLGSPKNEQQQKNQARTGSHQGPKSFIGRKDSFLQSLANFTSETTNRLQNFVKSPSHNQTKNSSQGPPPSFLNPQKQQDISLQNQTVRIRNLKSPQRNVNAAQKESRNQGHQYTMNYQTSSNAPVKKRKSPPQK